MGTRFRKSIKLGKHVRVNLSKSGIGYSVGTKGYRVTKMANGRTRTTVSIPGTGISHVSETSARSKSAIPHTYESDAAVVAPGAPATVGGRFLVALIAFAASIGVCILLVFAFTFFSDLGDSVSRKEPVFSYLEFAPLDPVSVPAGEDTRISVTYNAPINPADILVYADIPGIVRITRIEAYDYYAVYRIDGIEQGTCSIRASCDDVTSSLVSVTVTEPLPEITLSEHSQPVSDPLPYIANKNTKVIHRASCSRAPASGEYTADYDYFVTIGYRCCSYCFD